MTIVAATLMPAATTNAVESDEVQGRWQVVSMDGQTDGFQPGLEFVVRGERWEYVDAATNIKLKSGTLRLDSRAQPKQLDLIAPADIKAPSRVYNFWVSDSSPVRCLYDMRGDSLTITWRHPGTGQPRPAGMAGDGQFVIVHKRLASAKLVGPFVDGPYTASNGDTYRYFFGIYTGEFTQQRIVREADDFLNQLRKSGKSVETFTNGSAKVNPHRRYRVPYGDVMIVGWSNETRGGRGWMAVHNNDRDNRVTPQLQVLTSTGERHSLRGVPGDPNQSCSTTWQDGQDVRDRQMFLIQASTDVIRVFFPN